MGVEGSGNGRLQVLSGEGQRTITDKLQRQAILEVLARLFQLHLFFFLTTSSPAASPSAFPDSISRRENQQPAQQPASATASAASQRNSQRNSQCNSQPVPQPASATASATAACNRWLFFESVCSGVKWGGGK